MQYVLKSPGDR